MGAYLYCRVRMISPDKTPQTTGRPSVIALCPLPNRRRHDSFEWRFERDCNVPKVPAAAGTLPSVESLDPVLFELMVAILQLPNPNYR